MSPKVTTRLLLTLIALWLGPLLAAQEIGLSTNVADYFAGGTMNIEATYGFARHWSVNAGAKYNPFEYGKGQDAVALKQRSFSAGARWWPWHIYSGWWMGAKLQYQEYSTSGISSALSEEGDRYGGALSAGYSRMLGEHINLDFGLGLWAGYSLYSTFACRTCGRRLSSGGKSFVLPNELIFGISYIF